MSISVEKKPTKQWNIRITVELIERLGELGRPLGMTGNEFAAEALEKYAEVLARVMIDEREAHEQISEEHRRMILDKLQSASRR